MSGTHDMEVTASAAGDLLATAHDHPVSTSALLSHGRPTRLGRYVLLRDLGRGAMGEVHAAYHEGLERKLAIKVLSAHRVGRADLEARLRREARVLAKLSHPNVVQVYDVGEIEGHMFIAMEFVDGETLTSWMRRPHEVDEIVEMFTAAGRGLAAAHAAGVVHRDFKPDNVLVSADGRPRVLDFGLARRAEPEPKDAPEPEPKDARATPDAALLVTDAGALMGTPAYMSPEQFLGLTVDQRSDQFGFCVALHEALYGHRPFAGRSTMELAAATQAGEIVEPRTDAAVPSWLREVLLRGLSPAPEDRYPSMDELLAQLQREPQRRRPWWALGVAITGLVMLVAIWAPWSAPEPAACVELEDLRDQLWSASVREELGAAFEANPAPFASDAWISVAPRLDAWAERWVAQRVDACEATKIRHEFSAQVLTLRERCLDQRQRAFLALQSRLGDAGPATAERALIAAAALPEPADCANIDALLSAAPPAELAQEVAALRSELAQLELLALLDAGPELRARADATLDAARALGPGPLLAEALRVHGLLQDDHDAASESLREALDEAERSDHRALIPRVAVELAEAQAHDQLSRRVWARQALAGCDDAIELELRARQVLAELDRREGALDEAQAQLDRALELLDELGPGHPRGVGLLRDRADTLAAKGELEAARASYALAVDAALACFGGSHPQVAVLRCALAQFELGRGQPAAASAQRELALPYPCADPPS